MSPEAERLRDMDMAQLQLRRVMGRVSVRTRALSSRGSILSHVAGQQRRAWPPRSQGLCGSGSALATVPDLPDLHSIPG